MFFHQPNPFRHGFITSEKGTLMWQRCPICLSDTIKTRVFVESDDPHHFFNEAEITEQRCSCDLTPEQYGAICEEALMLNDEGIFDDAYAVAERD